MDFREKLNEHPILVSAILVALLAIVALLVYFTRPRVRGAGGDGETLWYFDLDQQQLFVHADTLESVKRESDFEGAPAGVRAYVFACGSCAEEKSRFVGYYERFTPAVLDRLKAVKLARYHELGDPPPTWIEAGRQRRAVGGSEWYDALSESGRYIETELYKKCPTNHLLECRP